MQIKIGYRHYALSIVEDLEDDANIHPEDREIKLSTRLSGPDAAAALIHELLHGIEYMTGVELTEGQVELFSKMLVLIFFENPKVLKMISEHIKNDNAN